MCAKHYENPTMLSRVTAKNVGNVFETQCTRHLSNIMTSHLRHETVAVSLVVRWPAVLLKLKLVLRL